MARNLMIQGTMSGVGKSLLTAAFCRIFHQDGFSVAPFKSQNMALNSFVTADGGEMGRAQVLQAQAAGREPDVRMNPVLLKPSSDTGSQVIVNGRVRGDYRASDYFKMKKTLIPEIMAAYRSLEAENDIIVIEGAGSPAEINLKAGDIVNMGMADLADAPVILVGDIDPGGVFAQLYGTLALLDPGERARVVGTVINKFRGDVRLLEPGLAMLEELTGVPVLGVVPYLRVDLDDEDSLSPRFRQTSASRPLDIAVIRLPHISNFTDFSPLERHGQIGLRYVSDVRKLACPDLVILPGSKNTMSDLLWMRENGLESAVRELSARDVPVLGICGGYQMLGRSISDPEHAEHGGEMEGMGLLPVSTVFSSRKTQKQTGAVVTAGPFAGAGIRGYQIHMGLTEGAAVPLCTLDDGTAEGAVCGNVFGTYLHGLFDSGELTAELAGWLMRRKGLDAGAACTESHSDFQQRQLDLLADTVRSSIDLDAVYRSMEEFDRG